MEFEQRHIGGKPFEHQGTREISIVANVTSPNITDFPELLKNCEEKSPETGKKAKNDRKTSKQPTQDRGRAKPRNSRRQDKV